MHALTTMLFAALLPAFATAQDPAPAKGPDKEIAEKCSTLKEVATDRKTARDDEGVQIIDVLVTKVRGGVDPKDLQTITKALEAVFMQGKVRQPENTRIYVAAAAALGFCGPDGAKVLKNAYVNKRFPEKPPYVPLREHLLRNLGKTKDESMVKFLIDEARRSPEAALQAAAGEALGNFEEAKESVRKQIVGDLIDTWGELAQAADLGTSNTESQNARDRLAALESKWNDTFARLTKQNFRKYRDWQVWHNKEKNKPW